MPPREVAPGLAPLRAEHERLLTVVTKESGTLSALREQHETEDAARGTALKAAFLSGGEAGEDVRATEEERSTALADAELRVEAAYDALVLFLGEAMAEVQRLAPALYDALDVRRVEAEQKRAEAQRLLAEAEQKVGEIDRLRFWLDRESGKSALGHIAFDQLATPRLEHVAAPKCGRLNMLPEHVVTREFWLAQAVHAGKFPPGRVDFYRQLFDCDPDGTAALLDSLEPVPAGLLTKPPAAFEALDDEVLTAARSHFPELKRRGRERSRGVVPPARAQHPLARGAGVGGSQAASPSAPEPAEVAEGLTDALFPEVARRRDQSPGRVTWVKGD